MGRRRFWVPGLLVAAVVCAALAQTATSPGFDPTGMIYVDMARHIAAGDGITASIFFPSHVPKHPSPIALWPPMYPAAIALLSLLGIAPALAARVISVAAFAASVVLVWRLGTVLFGDAVGITAAVLMLAWPPVIGIAAMALSENLFVMFVLLSVLLTVRVLKVTALERPYRLAAAGGLAMAAATLTRYPGLALAAIGAAALFVGLRGRAWRDRLALTSAWVAAALLPPMLLLVRNRLVTGALIGTGRPPDDGGLAYHTLYAVKAVGTDGLKLLWRVTVLPEALGLDSRVMILVVLGAFGAMLFGVVRSSRVRGGIRAAVIAPVATPEARVAAAVGLGYWAAMAVARSVTSFEPLNTRMLMPAYPLVLLGAVVMVVTFAERIGVRRVGVAGAVAALVAASLALVVVPRSVAAGGPRLAPDPAPAWVTWAAANTPPDAPILGNRSAEFNFYLARPTYSFQAYAVYRSGNRFDRDCRLIAGHLAQLGWSRAYLVLHAEEGSFDVDVMGRRYGPTIERLLRGEPALPVRLVARHPQFAAFEILGLDWHCAQD
ncbi:MAG: ArnT family glycosyltransferase [Armatimonadota bacterium]